MLKTWFASICFLLVLSLSSTPALAEDPPSPPALRIRLDHPDQQLEQLIHLFDRARTPNPAAALSAWKRASREPDRLGKPLEALIASLNPGMIGELKTLDSAEFSVRFDPETGQADWSAILPKDDGTFAALGSAFVLSGGEAQAPLGDLQVDRLAGSGSALLAKARGGTLLAGNRSGLVSARRRLERPKPPLPQSVDTSPGLSLEIEPDGLQGARLLFWQSIGELAKLSGSRAHLRLEGDRLFGSIDGVALGSIPQRPIDPTWFDWTPRGRALASFAMGLDHDPKSWDAAFALADRVEKLDPTKANLAPIRLRLDLLCRLAGITLDGDLLSRIRGIHGWIGSDGKVIDSAVLIIELDEPSAAERIRSRIKPILGQRIPRQLEKGNQRDLGELEGRPLRICRADASVVLSWGDRAEDASILAREQPAMSDGRVIREALALDRKSSLGGLFWPGRAPISWVLSDPLREALSEARPIAWRAGPEDLSTFEIKAEWPGLDAIVRRFLVAIPLDPPPDH